MPMIYIYNIYAYLINIYTSFPSPSDSDLIKIYMFNCITDLTECFYHNYISLNMTKTIIDIIQSYYLLDNI